MNTNYLILSMLALQPTFCMENYTPYEGKKPEKTQNLPKIPQEVFEAEILPEAVINLIKRYVNSNEPNCLKAFFEELNKFCVDKRTTQALRRYFPARQDCDKALLPFTSLIVFAAQTNNLKLCELILQHTEPQAEDLILAIAFATKNKNENIRDLIINQTKIDKLDINQGTSFGNLGSTINNYASLTNMKYVTPRFIKYLILNGISIHTANANGETPLMAVATSSDHSSEYKVKLLLSQPQIDVNAQTNESYILGAGWTALMQAVSAGSKKMVLQLLNHGADKTIRNQSGETAHDLAIEYGYLDIAELLRESHE